MAYGTIALPGGQLLAFDTIPALGAFGRYKISFGAEGEAVDVDATNRFPVAVDSLPLPAGAATAAAQATLIGHVDGIEATLATIAGHVDGLEAAVAALGTKLDAANASLDVIETEATRTGAAPVTRGGTITGAVVLDTTELNASFPLTGDHAPPAGTRSMMLRAIGQPVWWNPVGTATTALPSIAIEPADGWLEFPLAPLSEFREGADGAALHIIFVGA